MLNQNGEKRIERLEKCGYVYKRLSEHWLLIRKYATKRKLLYHFIRPKRIK